MDRFKDVLNTVKNIYQPEKKNVEETYEVLSSLLTHTADAIAILTPEGTVKQVNPAFENLYGWKNEELQGKSLPFTNDDFQKESDELLERGRLGETISSHETKRSTKHGDIIHVSLTLSPIRNEKGEVVALSSIIRNNEERIKADRKLEESKSRYQSLFENSPDAIFSLDLKGNILKTNTACEQILECTKDELKGTPILQLISHEDVDLVREKFKLAVQGNTATYKVTIERKDSIKRQMMITTIPIIVNEQVIGVYCVGQDATEKLEALDALTESEERYRLIAENSQDLITVHDINGEITYASPSHVFLLGYEPTQLVGKTLECFIHPEDAQTLNQLFYESIMTQKPFTTRLRKKTRSEIWVWYELKGSPVLSEADKLSHVVLIAREISKQIDYEKELKGLAFFDELTKLPNRRLFHDRLQQAMTYAIRNQYKFAVLYLDGDGFKEINDTYGHDIGDAFLIEVAKRIKNTIREEDTISRLGGDEFAVLLPRIMKESEIHEAVKRIIDRMAEPLDIKGHIIQATFSVGIATFPNDGNDVETLLKNADDALYAAKENGKSGFEYYSNIK